MSDKIEIVKGSGNLFKDFGYVDAQVHQFKAQLAAEIIRVLNQKDLSTRQAEKQTGIAYADFSRIRNADLSRFTVDKMMKVLGRLNRKVKIEKFTTIRVRSNETRATT